MLRWLLLSGVVLASAGPAYSAGRYYCAVDDGNVKLSLDVGFEEAAARKLNHFRGALIAKAAAVPSGFKTLMLDSSQLAHYWSYDGDLRLEVFARGEDQDAGKSFDLIIMSSAKDGTAPMSGSYVLTFDVPDAKPLELKGPLTCSVK
ncbi:hypothetical protein [Rhizobium tubonense]|uniref:Uncharacterized protein n=1 Tax=Rhizobium tubonense TaxID=484088 RepID=A0A2W4E997_9HYPH|nr:hypothetical protein [Rhizobium tubonense]PZM11906.1 hypothetical protein CPY51_17480 [Rhizobium tubonense]